MTCHAEIGQRSRTSGGLDARVDTHALRSGLCLQHSRSQLGTVGELEQFCCGSNVGSKPGEPASTFASSLVLSRPRMRWTSPAVVFSLLDPEQVLDLLDH